jgi:hypothetical protein
MTFYVAGRTAQGDSLVRQVINTLQAAGHQITFDWTTHPDFKPYHEHKQASIEAALHMKSGAMTAEAFILVWDDSLYGALIELGMALAASSPQQPKQIFILGPKERVVIFEMLPEFKVVENIDQLLTYLTK